MWTKYPSSLFVQFPPCGKMVSQPHGCIWGQLLFECLASGNGNPLQSPCFGNRMNRGAWRATVLGVAKSQTQLSDWAHWSLSWRRHNSIRGQPGRVLEPQVGGLALSLSVTAGLSGCPASEQGYVFALYYLSETQNLLFTHSSLHPQGCCIRIRNSLFIDVLIHGSLLLRVGLKLLLVHLLCPWGDRV